ncbi:hypothetical protein LINPERHAP2_LOCUS33185, partial [Linum perenne]
LASAAAPFQPLALAGSCRLSPTTHDVADQPIAGLLHRFHQPRRIQPPTPLRPSRHLCKPSTPISIPPPTSRRPDAAAAISPSRRLPTSNRRPIPPTASSRLLTAAASPSFLSNPRRRPIRRLPTSLTASRCTQPQPSKPPAAIISHSHCPQARRPLTQPLAESRYP